jgi:molybdopterin converting factor small subunit
MKITVRLAEPYWRAVGKRDLELELIAGARLTDLLAFLNQQYPALSKEIAETPPLMFVGETAANMETALTDGAHIHLVWQIGGG